MSDVVFLKVTEISGSGVEETVRHAMTLGEWDRYITGNKIFVKINGISDQVVPGQCTSPWVLEAALKVVREKYPHAELSMGDTNLAAAEQFNKAAELWRFKELAEQYNVRLVNLAEDATKEVEVGGKIFKKLELPVTLIDADSILNIPVMKSHCLTTITCCLKNHWGCVPRFRHQYHPVADQCIPDINFYFKKTRFNLIDGTISMEGNAPRTGISKICNVIFASSDRVAADYTVARYMGFDADAITHIKNAEDMGIGSRKNISIIGDPFEINPFKAPEPDKQPIFKYETMFRKIPGVKQILFDTPIFNGLCSIATFYNTNIWYNSEGKKYIRQVMATEYAKEFGPIYDKNHISFAE